MVQDRTTRRDVLGSVAAAGLAGVAGCLDGGGEETETVSGSMHIGVMQPLSGDLAYYGQQSIWGFFSGLAHKAGEDPIGPDDTQEGDLEYEVNDVTYELSLRDTQFSADTAEEVATNLVEDDVDMLFGCSSSSSARRVINNVVKPAGDVPYMAGPSASAGITSNSETCRENVFRASENTAMDARSGGKYVANNTDVNSVYLFGADYSFGRAVVNNYRAVLEAEGVEIVGERLVERGYDDDWEGLLNNAEDAGADGIVGGFTVVTLPHMFGAFLTGDYSFNIFGGFATQITNGILGGVLQNVLGEPLTEEKLANSQLGPFTTRYHWNQYDNEINSSFVDTYTNAYGVVPDLFTSGTFTAASAIDQAVRSGGATDGETVASELRGMTVQDTPKGEGAYTFQSYNNQARSSMTVANLIPTTDEYSETWGAPIMPGEPVATVSGADATIPSDSDQMNCSL